MKRMIISAVCGIVLAAFSGAAQTNATSPISAVVINGTSYSLGTSTIVATMTHGQGDKSFAVTIHGSGMYGFSVRGYGVGFPTYGIMADTSSGGALGDATLKLHFSDQHLPPADGNKPKVYKGYIPIHIFLESETGRDTNFLKLPVTLTVLPGPPPPT